LESLEVISYREFTKTLHTLDPIFDTTIYAQNFNGGTIQLSSACPTVDKRPTLESSVRSGVCIWHWIYSFI